MTYDAGGMRTGRTSAAKEYRYVYSGSTLTQMTVGYTMLEFSYDAAGTPMTVTYGYVTYYYVTNLQGDVIAIVNNQGQKVVEYTYDAWGNILSTTGSMASTLGQLNPLRYRGYVYDQETGFYYLQSRYYDPNIGRFLNADAFASTGQGILGNNMFAYCGNNPVMYLDGSGYAADFVIDLFFCGWDIYNLVANEGWKDWKNWVALGVDAAFAVVPFVTGGGGQIVKLANVAEDISDFNKVTVVGETMTRVQTISQFVNAADNIYDGFKAYDRLKDMGKGGKVLAEIGGKANNLAWLYGKLRKGYTVVDIGIDVGRTTRSSSYFCERFLLNVWKYRNVWKLPYHIFPGGVG